MSVSSDVQALETKVTALVTVLPQGEKVVADLEALEQTPQLTAVIADAKAFIASLKALA